MTIYRRAAGAYAPAIQPSIKIAGAWAPATAVWKKIAGVWTKAWPDVAPPPVGGGVGSVQLFSNEYNGDDLPGNMTLNPNGSVTSTVVGFTPYNWLLSGTANQYEVFCQVTGGAFNNGPTNTWVNLATTQTWSRFAVGFATGQFSIRRASDQLLLAGPTEIKLIRESKPVIGGGTQ